MNNKTSRIAIIVLNWNAPQETISCLESILAVLENNKATLIVCDNNSSDHSVADIQQWAYQHFPARIPDNSDDAEFVLFQIETNCGYAAGNNVGIQYTIDHDFEYVWILNNDTLVEQGALTALIDYVEQHTDIACCGSTLVDYSNPDKVQCAGGCQYNPLTTVRTEIYHNRDLSWVQIQEQMIDLDYVCGAAMFLRISAMKEIGLLNQRFFLYYEELDLAQRLKQAGYKLGWVKTSIVQHHQSSSKQATLEQQQFLHYHENLSTLIYTWAHHRPIFILAAGFRLMVKTLILPLTNRSKLLPSLLNAYYDFYRHSHQITNYDKAPNITAQLFLKK